MELVDSRKSPLLPPECLIYSTLLSLTETGNEEVPYSVMSYEPEMLRDLPNSPVKSVLEMLKCLQNSREQELFMKKQILAIEETQRQVETVSSTMLN